MHVAAVDDQLRPLGAAASPSNGSPAPSAPGRPLARDPGCAGGNPAVPGQVPDWNALRILHDFARIDRHRTLHLVTSFSSYAWAKVNPDLIADLDVHLGVVPEDGVMATFRWLGDGEITPYDFDLDFEFQIEMAGVTESLGPGCEVPARPYGPLDKRLHALLPAVAEYSSSRSPKTWQAAPCRRLRRSNGRIDRVRLGTAQRSPCGRRNRNPRRPVAGGTSGGATTNGGVAL